MTHNQKIALYGGGALFGAVCWSFIVYKAIEPADREGLRQLFVLLLGWLAPMLFIGGIALTRWLTVREIKAHDRGMDKGLDKVIGAAEKVATTRTTMITTIKRPPDGLTAMPTKPAANDYLPVMRLKSGDPHNPIEM